VDLTEKKWLNDKGLALSDLGADGGWFNLFIDWTFLGFNLFDPLGLLDNESWVVDDGVAEFVEADTFNSGSVIISVNIEESVLVNYHIE